MKINIRQFADNGNWTPIFQLHFIINNLDTKTATYHEGNRSYNHGLLYEDDRFTGLIEPFKFEGEIE